MRPGIGPRRAPGISESVEANVSVSVPFFFALAEGLTDFTPRKTLAPLEAARLRELLVDVFLLPFAAAAPSPARFAACSRLATFANVGVSQSFLRLLGATR